jgi:hypothetical protein
LKNKGSLYIAGKERAKFESMAGETADVYVQNGCVTKVVFPARGVTREFAVIVDNASGAWIDSFAGRMKPQRLQALEDVTITNYLLPGDGRVVLGNRDWGRFSAHAGEKVELLVQKGLVRRVSFADGTQKEFGLICDAASGKPVDSFIQLGGMAGLDNVTIKHYRLDAQGVLNIGGCANAARLARYPDAEIECDIAQGVVTAVRVMEDGAAVYEKRLALMYDNTTGRLVGSFDNLGAEQLKGLADHTIRRVFADTNGTINIGGAHHAGGYAGAEAELTVRDGVVVGISYPGHPAATSAPAVRREKVRARPAPAPEKKTEPKVRKPRPAPRRAAARKAPAAAPVPVQETPAETPQEPEQTTDQAERQPDVTPRETTDEAAPPQETSPGAALLAAEKLFFKKQYAAAEHPFIEAMLRAYRSGDPYDKLFIGRKAGFYLDACKKISAATKAGVSARTINDLVFTLWEVRYAYLNKSLGEAVRLRPTPA